MLFFNIFFYLSLCMLVHGKWIGKGENGKVTGRFYREDSKGDVVESFIDGVKVSAEDVVYVSDRAAAKSRSYCGVVVSAEVGEFYTNFLFDQHGDCTQAKAALKSKSNFVHKFSDGNFVRIPTSELYPRTFVTVVSPEEVVYQDVLDHTLPECVGVYNKWDVVGMLKYVFCKAKTTGGVYFWICSGIIVVTILIFSYILFFQTYTLLHVLLFVPYWVIFKPLLMIFSSDLYTNNKRKGGKKRRGGSANSSSFWFFFVCCGFLVHGVEGLVYQAQSGDCVHEQQNAVLKCKTYLDVELMSGANVLNFELEKKDPKEIGISDKSVFFEFNILDKVDYELYYMYDYCHDVPRVVETKRTCDGWFYRENTCNNEAPYTITEDECAFVMGAETGFGLSNGCLSMSPSLTCAKMSVKRCDKPYKVYELKMGYRQLMFQFDSTELSSIEDVSVESRHFSRLNERSKYIMVAGEHATSNADIFKSGVFVDASPEGTPIANKIGWNQWRNDERKCSKPQGFTCYKEVCSIQEDRPTLSSDYTHNFYMNDIKTVSDRSLILNPSPVRLRMKVAAKIDLTEGKPSVVDILRGSTSADPVRSNVKSATCVEAVTDKFGSTFEMEYKLKKFDFVNITVVKGTFMGDLYDAYGQAGHCNGDVARHDGDKENEVSVRLVCYVTSMFPETKKMDFLQRGFKDGLTLDADARTCKVEHIVTTWSEDVATEHGNFVKESIYSYLFTFADKTISNVKFIYSWMINHKFSMFEIVLVLIVVLLGSYVIVSAFGGAFLGSIGTSKSRNRKRK